MKESKIFTERNLAEKVHYVYRVIIDEKYYIGKRSGSLNDLETGAYATSSKLVQEKLQNGLHFSKIKIIQVFSSSKDALEFESRILTRVDAKANPKFLNQCNGGDGDFTCKQHTEKSKEKMKERFNPETELGLKRREDISNKRKEYFNPETELGRLHLEENRERQKARYNINTEEGRKRREIHSKIMKEKAKVASKKRAKTLIQNRQNDSILGELMFDEAFIKENFLIIDDKNNLRFLWSVYSKLSGYSKSHIKVHKRNGGLSFLSGIESISLTEELESVKIEEIKAIIKSRNNEKRVTNT